ncbi:MAG: hypothetical protein IPJ88_01905 [Myxococcales bacterium]|nr:MAG: hypothetical protein IPJ88_01905 [Myxococcales bacterium]
MLSLLSFSKASAQTITPDWSMATGGSTDGMALGDTDGDGRDEIALVIRDGSYVSGDSQAGIGTLALLSGSGELLWQVQASHALVGFPTMGDFDGDGLKEIAVCDVASVGTCRVYDGDGSLLFQIGDLFYPAMSNGGPAAVNVDADPADEIVVVAWGGQIVVAEYDGSSTGSELWRYDWWCPEGSYHDGSYWFCPPDDTWADEGESLFGHPAIGDMDGDGALDVVVCSWAGAGLYAFDALNGTPKWNAVASSNPARFTPGNNCNGSGPVLADLDGNPGLEAVVTLSSYDSAVPPALEAYRGDGSLLWHRDLPGAGLDFTSPVITDADGDGSYEIFVQESGGTLYSFMQDGSPLSSVSVGTESWVTPALIDINNDNLVEIITASLSSVKILNGTTFAELYRYDDPTAGFFPPAVQGELDGDGKVEVLFSSWNPQRLFGIKLDGLVSYPWTTFAGTSAHDGLLDATGTINTDPGVVSEVVTTELENLINDPSTSRRAKRYLTNTQGDLENFQIEMLRGRISSALDYLRDAVIELYSADRRGIDVDALQGQIISQIALQSFEQFIQRAQSMMGQSHAAVVAAYASLQNATNDLDSSSWLSYYNAITEIQNGASALESALEYDTNYCANMAPSEPYHQWICRAQQLRQSVLDLIPGGASSPNLVSFGDTWRYDDRRVDRGTSWLNLTYNDSSWSTGSGQFGYGDGDETTTISSNSNMRSAYFRKVITLNEPVTTADLTVLHDDGVAVWINGSLVLQKYTSNGLNYSAYASSTSAENELSTLSFGSSNPFVVGDNIIAVMVKRRNKRDRDFSFDLELVKASANTLLTEAVQSIEEAVYWMARLDLKQAGIVPLSYPGGLFGFSAAEQSLSNVVASPDTSSVRADLCLIVDRLTRIYLDDASVTFGTTDPNVISAEALYQAATVDRNSGSWTTAMDKYGQAAMTVYP